VPLEFLVACDHQNGHHGALQLFGTLIGRGHNLLNQKRERYRKDAFEGVILHTPDQSVNDNWALAKANLLMLEADYEPYLPGYYLAGIPEYPQLFGCDNTYTTPGALAAGFASMMRSTLNVLGDYALRGCGRVPHEVTTNGRVFNPGNTQETPQFAIAVWDYVCWTGDLAFLRMMYPICREGVLEYLPSLWGGHEDGYPTGDAMVERHGMGSRKLDSACYLYAAWRALAEMARVLQRPEASEYERRAAEWLEHFEQDWWMADEGLYADSLHTDYRPQLDGHWTQVVPLQLGITQPSRAEGVLDRVEQEFTNEWGLVHTRKREERVWTLPTGLLILAQLRHGRTKHALQFLDNIALTARYGMLGAFKELIPEGLCFVQLWSAGLYIQCVVEGVLGIQPLAHEHTVRIVPTLPDTWPEATISGLPIGEHLLNITVGKDACRVEHRIGSQPLRVQFTARGTTVAAIRCAESVQNNVSLENGALVFSVDVGQNVQLQANGGTAYLTYNQL
jgi:glycogen debranching enzyme